MTIVLTVVGVVSAFELFVVTVFWVNMLHQRRLSASVRPGAPTSLRDDLRRQPRHR